MRRSLDHADIGVQEMADHLLRGRNTVGGWLSGRTKPSPRVLKRWADLTGVKYEWLNPDDHAPESEPGSKDRRDPSRQETSRSGWCTAGNHPPRVLTVMPDVAA
jgi:transcriptional regulator with XRE-family HTH domain